MRKFDTFIFDMDGTLLDSLPDLIIVTNKALASVGFPERTDEEILGFVGSGARALINLAVPASASDDLKQRVYENWRNLYPDYGTVKTKPYPGMVDALCELRRRGAKTAILSNKYDAAVKELAKHYFPGLILVAKGESSETPRKPDPAGLLGIIDTLSSAKADTAYIGDSHTDVETALNAGVFCIGCPWGYGGEASLRIAGADVVVSGPAEIVEFCR